MFSSLYRIVNVFVLFLGLGIGSFAHHSFPLFNERCERIAQVAHQKWATMSNSLRSLTKNERMSKSLVFLSESLIRSFFRKKQAICSENQWANSQPWLFSIAKLTFCMSFRVWSLTQSYLSVIFRFRMVTYHLVFCSYKYCTTRINTVIFFYFAWLPISVFSYKYSITLLFCKVTDPYWFCFA